MASFGSEVAQENQSNFGIKLGPRNQHNSSHWHTLYIYLVDGFSPTETYESQWEG